MQSYNWIMMTHDYTGYTSIDVALFERIYSEVPTPHSKTMYTTPDTTIIIMYASVTIVVMHSFWFCYRYYQEPFSFQDNIYSSYYGLSFQDAYSNGGKKSSLSSH